MKQSAYGSRAQRAVEPGLVLEALQDECSYKPGYQKSAGIGFLSELNQLGVR